MADGQRQCSESQLVEEETSATGSLVRSEEASNNNEDSFAGIAVEEKQLEHDQDSSENVKPDQV